MTRIVAIVSGGLDSVVLAHDLMQDDPERLRLLSFNYGQRHVKELDAARACANRLGVPHDIIDLRSLAPLIRSSALTDPTRDVPLGHYEAPSMRATVVPNRNMLMIAMAAAVAVSEGADRVAIGVHAGDHAVYPDCRPRFIDVMTAALEVATEGHSVSGFRVLAPYVNMRKQDIVTRGDAIAVPFAETWSCYQGGSVHCGQCGTCVERREAFALAGVTDPTAYACDGAKPTPDPQELTLGPPGPFDLVPND